MKRFARGLVVGKFCPLHRGHEHLIDAALQACDEVLVIGYTRPEIPYCDAAERERWFGLRYPPSRFPGLRVCNLGADGLAADCAQRGIAQTPPAMPFDDDPDDEVHRRFCGWICRHWFGCSRMDAVFTSESYGDGFAASLEAQFGSRVVHVAVDPARRQVPVSGSVLRADPRAHRQLLAPEVYASLVPRIAVLGGESSGKTSLARALAQALGTVPVEEYGRQRWVEQGGVLAYEDLLHIAQVQVEREYTLAAASPADWLVCDTTPLTTLFYSLADHGRAEPRLFELSRRAYALAVLCEPDFPFEQDGTRRDAAFRARQHEWYRERLAQQGARVLRVGGPPAARLGQVLRALGPLR